MLPSLQALAGTGMGANTGAGTGMGAHGGIGNGKGTDTGLSAGARSLPNLALLAAAAGTVTGAVSEELVYFFGT